MSAALPPLAFDLLVYPGLLWLLLLVLGVGRIAGGPASGGQAVRGMVEALAGRLRASAIAVACVTLALLCLPWPGLPGRSGWEPRPWAMWALVEVSALLLLLPGLAGTSAASRAAVRELQMGVSARLPLWLVTSLLLLPGSSPSPAILLLALLAGVFALPVAGRWWIFDSSSLPGDVMLSEMEAALLQLHGRVHTIFWLALLATVLVPLPHVDPWIELLLRGGIIITGAALVRVARGRFVTATVPVALRWCWWLALPCAVAALFLS